MARTTTQRPLAVVTGASSGIGFELAREFAANDYDLVVAAEDDGIEQAAAELRGIGGDAQSVQVDLATSGGVEHLHSQIAGRPVAALAINAGIGVAGGRFVDTSLDAHLALVDLNVRGAVQLAYLELQDMVARNEGGVLFTSSIAATMPGPFQSTYNASKSFLLSFSEALHNELKDTGVTVTALMPGPTDTDFFARAELDDTKLGQAKKDDPAEVARDGVEALLAGKDHVIAGSMKNTLQAMAAKVLPATTTAGASAKMSEPGSGSSD